MRITPKLGSSIFGQNKSPPEKMTTVSPEAKHKVSLKKFGEKMEPSAN